MRRGPVVPFTLCNRVSRAAPLWLSPRAAASAEAAPLANSLESDGLKLFGDVSVLQALDPQSILTA